METKTKGTQIQKTSPSIWQHMCCKHSHHNQTITHCKQPRWQAMTSLHMDASRGGQKSIGLWAVVMLVKVLPTALHQWCWKINLNRWFFLYLFQYHHCSVISITLFETAVFLHLVLCCLFEAHVLLMKVFSECASGLASYMSFLKVQCIGISPSTNMSHNHW